MVSKDDRILSYDPFEGDFGEPDDKTFSDKMAVARKPGPCGICDQTIQIGERVRRRVDRSDGSIATYRFCAACCEAMAKYEDDDGEAIEARTAMHPSLAYTKSA